MSKTLSDAPALAPGDRFPERHIGPSDEDVAQMLSVLGLTISWLIGRAEHYLLDWRT